MNQFAQTTELASANQKFYITNIAHPGDAEPGSNAWKEAQKVLEDLGANIKTMAVTYATSFEATLDENGQEDFPAAVTTAVFVAMNLDVQSANLACQFSS